MMRCLAVFKVAMICAISSLSGWSYCEERCLVWLRRRNVETKLLVHANVSIVRDVVCSISRNNA